MRSMVEGRGTAQGPLYLDGLTLVRLEAMMRRGGRPPAPTLRQRRPMPLRLQPWWSQGSLPLSRTTEQSVDFQSHRQGRLP